MADLPEFAISVHAPWAWALMFAGKDVENRSMTFGRRRGGVEVLGRVWVHASLWPGNAKARPDILFEEFLAVVRRLAPDANAAIPLTEKSMEYLDGLRGHIVGSIEVTGYRTPDDPPDSPWYVPGSLAIMVRDPKPLKTLVPAKGALGWWRPTEDVCEQLRRSA